MLVSHEPNAQLERPDRMDDTQAGIAAAVAEIETALGGRWGAWLSDTGRWWATRRHRLTSSQQRAGCVPFLHAPNADELARRISMQEDLAGTATPTHPMPQATTR